RGFKRGGFKRGGFKRGGFKRGGFKRGGFKRGGAGAAEPVGTGPGRRRLGPKPHSVPAVPKQRADRRRDHPRVPGRRETGPAKVSACE
ncbi:hypothetical protein AB0M44_44885, partial [Streptosporangium subroseum]|uniref:hypothetical protein n=1 Tax=Streptosporangium subroseum TaxID=106412 RepID=UPI003431FABE